MSKNKEYKEQSFGAYWDSFLGSTKMVFPDLEKAISKGKNPYEYKTMCGVSPQEYEAAKSYIFNTLTNIKSAYNSDQLRQIMVQSGFANDKALKASFETVYKYEKYKSQVEIWDLEKRIESTIKRINPTDRHQMEALFVEGRNLQIARGNYDTIRLGNINDVIDKELFRNGLSEIIQNSHIISSNARFHGCRLSDAEQIIQSHGISSAADRNSFGFGISDSSGEFSVTRPNEIGLTLGDDHTETSYTNLKNNISYPGGCVFVLMSSPEMESVMHQMPVDGMSFSNITKMKNVDFDQHPEILAGIITTEENKMQVQQWCQNFGLNTQVFSENEYAMACLSLEIDYNQKQSMQFIADVIERPINEFEIQDNNIVWDISKADTSGQIQPFPVNLGTINEQGQLYSCVTKEDFVKWAEGIDFSNVIEQERDDNILDLS